MSKQTINIGASPNDGTGTPLRTSFDYTNQNFTELYTAVGPSGNNIVVPGSAAITGDLTVDTSTLKVDSANDAVGIGTTSPTTYGAKLAVFGSGNGILAVGNATSYTTLQSNGNDFYLNMKGVGSTIFRLGSGDTESMRLNPTGNVVLKGGTIGATGVGVTFPAAQIVSSDANCLDDYEEGTWTPSFENITLGNGIVTGFYTKIGNTVSVMFKILFGSTTVVTSSVLTISGLPFSIDTMAVGYVDLLRQGVGQYAGVVVRSSATVFNFRALSVSGATVLSSVLNATSPATWATGDEFTAQVTYRAS